MKDNNPLSTAIRVLLLVVLAVYLAFHFVSPINLMTADIGRHIRNGELILNSSANPLRVNLYSYTMPEQHVINHHWASGVVFYKIWQWAGFEGLSIFYLVLFLATVLLYFWTAQRLANFPFALFFTFITIPLIAERAEIRPEGFSAFFLGLYLYLLVRWKRREFPSKLLWIIPVLQILWTNLHVFFFLGIFALAVFALDSWINNEGKDRLREIVTIAIAAVLACLVNPFGWELLVLPLATFGQFGYRLAENQTPFFMIKRFPDYPAYAHFFFIAVTFIVGLCLAVRPSNWKKYLWSIIIAVVALAMGLKVVRCMALFAMVFISVAAWYFFGAAQKLPALWGSQINRKIVLLVGLTMAVSFVTPYSPLCPFTRFDPWINKRPLAEKPRNWLELGVRLDIYTGLVPGINAAAEFYKSAGIEGPIFNNYDIGGYLIYHLYPRERLFVDNRPEAYTVSFFKDTYIPMQEDESVWQKVSAQYQFNAIFFYRHDLTPWGQDFLIKRVQDAGWAPVFVDDYAIILLKRNDKNAALISRFELPREMFQVLRKGESS